MSGWSAATGCWPCCWWPGSTLRVITQLAYQPALLYIDSPKYLLSGLQKYDPQGYRVLMVEPLAWIGNLGVVAEYQHLLGLAMAVTIYVVLRRRNAPRWAAALATAPVLLDAYQLQMEQTIMPDVLFEALIVAGLAILAWKPRPVAHGHRGSRIRPRGVGHRSARWVRR